MLYLYLRKLPVANRHRRPPVGTSETQFQELPSLLPPPKTTHRRAVEKRITFFSFCASTCCKPTQTTGENDRAFDDNDDSIKKNCLRSLAILGREKNFFFVSRKWFKSTLVLVPLFGSHYSFLLLVSIAAELLSPQVEVYWMYIDQTFSSFQVSRRKV